MYEFVINSYSIFRFMLGILTEGWDLCQDFGLIIQEQCL